MGWISALDSELSAAILMLDEEYPSLPRQANDNNAYYFGRMGNHKVVLACLPDGVYGITSAATVAQNMVRSFGSIKFGLMVGIGAGVPSPEYPIHLGDVAVSAPSGMHGGVIQYDAGKVDGNGKHILKGSLNKPPQVLLTAVTKLKASHRIGRNKIPERLAKLPVDNFENPEDFQYQGLGKDRLFQSIYQHHQVGESCDSCDQTMVLPRSSPSRTRASRPVIHYGTIASGSRVVKHSQTRDNLAAQYNVCCIEMEAAGLMDNFPCLVVRGSCDYGDSHKQDNWQQYAALTAAAYARELLDYVDPVELQMVPRLNEIIEGRYILASTTDHRMPC